MKRDMGPVPRHAIGTAGRLTTSLSEPVLFATDGCVTTETDGSAGGGTERVWLTKACAASTTAALISTMDISAALPMVSLACGAPVTTGVDVESMVTM